MLDFISKLHLIIVLHVNWFMPFNFKGRLLLIAAPLLWFIAIHGEAKDCAGHECELNFTENVVTDSVNANDKEMINKFNSVIREREKKDTVEDVEQAQAPPYLKHNDSHRIPVELPDVHSIPHKECEIYVKHGKLPHPIFHTNPAKNCIANEYSNFYLLDFHPTSMDSMQTNIIGVKAVNGCLYIESPTIRDISNFAQLSTSSNFDPSCSQLFLLLKDTSGNHAAIDHLLSIFKGDRWETQRFIRHVKFTKTCKTQNLPLKKMSDIGKDCIVIQGDFIIDDNTKIDQKLPKIEYLEAGCVRITNKDFIDFDSLRLLEDNVNFIRLKCADSTLSEIKGTFHDSDTMDEARNKLKNIFENMMFDTTPTTTSTMPTTNSSVTTVNNGQSKTNTKASGPSFTVTVLPAGECKLPVPLRNIEELYELSSARCTIIHGDLIIDKSTIINEFIPSLRQVHGCIRVNSNDVIHLKWMFDENKQQVVPFKYECSSDQSKKSEFVLSVVNDKSNASILSHLERFNDSGTIRKYGEKLTYFDPIKCHWPKGGVDPKFARIWVLKYDYMCQKSVTLRMEDDSEIIDLSEWDDYSIKLLFRHKKNVRANIRIINSTTVNTFDLTHIKVFGKGMLELRNNFELKILGLDPNSIFCDSKTHSACFKLIVRNNSNLLSQFLAYNWWKMRPNLQPELACVVCPGGRPLAAISALYGCIDIDGDLVIDESTKLDSMRDSKIRYIRGCVRIVNRKLTLDQLSFLMDLEKWNILRVFCEDGSESELDISLSTSELDALGKYWLGNLEYAVGLGRFSHENFVKFFETTLFNMSTSCTVENFYRECKKLNGDLLLSKKVAMDFDLYENLKIIKGNLIIFENYADVIKFPRLKYITGNIIVTNNKFLERLYLNYASALGVYLYNNPLLRPSSSEALAYNLRAKDKNRFFNDADPLNMIEEAQKHKPDLPSIPPPLSVPAVFEMPRPIQELDRSSLKSRLEAGPNNQNRFNVAPIAEGGAGSYGVFPLIALVVVFFDR